MSRPIPAIWRIDVEPDDHQHARGSSRWSGFLAQVDAIDALRPRLEDRSGAPVHPTWLLRLDPDIERGFGRVVIERHGALIDRLRRSGDPFGIHVHAYRWNDERQVTRLRRRPRQHEPLNPWRPWPSPRTYWDLVARAAAEQPARYVAFAVRSDAPDSEMGRRTLGLVQGLADHPIGKRLRFVDPLSPEIRRLAVAPPGWKHGPPARQNAATSSADYSRTPRPGALARPGLTVAPCR